MIYQNDPKIMRECPELWHYGCAFISLAYYREKREQIPWSADALIECWMQARKYGIISGDLNGDGDTDDYGECEIQDWTKLCKILGLSISYIPGHFSPKSIVKPDQYSICAWYNARTKFTHFVVGTSRPVEFDPISGGSVTVREGAPRNDGLRIFEKIER